MNKIHSHPLVIAARRKAEQADEIAREAAGKIQMLRRAESSAFGKYTRGHCSESGFHEIQQKRIDAENEAKRLRIEADRLRDGIANAENEAAEEMSREIGERIRALTPEYLDALEEAAPYLQKLMRAGAELDAIYTELGKARTITLRRHGVAIEAPFPNPTLSAALPGVSAEQFSKALERCLKTTEEIHA